MWICAGYQAHFFKWNASEQNIGPSRQMGWLWPLLFDK